MSILLYSYAVACYTRSVKYALEEILMQKINKVKGNQNETRKIEKIYKFVRDNT